jgi:hypothetical protein
MERSLIGRRASSKLPQLIELVSPGMIVKAVDVTPQAAVRIVGELGFRETRGREVSDVRDPGAGLPPAPSGITLDKVYTFFIHYGCRVDFSLCGSGRIFS